MYKAPAARIYPGGGPVNKDLIQEIYGGWYRGEYTGSTGTIIDILYHPGYLIIP